MSAPNQDDREALHSALVGVVSNASNYPRAVQPRLLGQNLGVFRALLVETVLAAGFRRRAPITNEMVEAALDARASMSQHHIYLYATGKCRCGDDWSDPHWMRYILEAAEAVR